MRTKRAYKVTVVFRLFGLVGREVLTLRADEAREARTTGHTLVWEACSSMKGLKVLHVESEVLKDFRGETTPSNVFAWEKAWVNRFMREHG